MFPFLSGIGNIKPWTLKQNGNCGEKAMGDSMTYRADSYGLSAKALLELKSMLAV